MRGIAGYATMFVALGFLAGCEKDSLRPGPGEELPDASFIDEPIVLERSDPVPLSRVDGDDFIIDVSEAPLVSGATYNDFIISYWTPSSCDEDTYVHNSETDTWEQIGFAIDPGSGLGCRASPREQFHLLSARGSVARQCLNDSAQIRLRGPIFTYYDGMEPTAEALRINPDYFAVPIPARYASWGFNGLAYDEGSLWTSSDWFNKIYRLSYSGAILSELEPPSGKPSGMASDGQNLWLADRDGAVFKINEHGDVLRSFSIQVHSATGLAFGAGKLWVADYGRRHPPQSAQIYGIDPVASPDGGSAAIIDTLDVPGGRSFGLAWDGAHLLVASDSLYKVTENGIVKDSYALPVFSVRDIAWDGEGVLATT